MLWRKTLLPLLRILSVNIVLFDAMLSKSRAHQLAEHCYRCRLSALTQFWLVGWLDGWFNFGWLACRLVMKNKPLGDLCSKAFSRTSLGLLRASWSQPPGTSWGFGGFLGDSSGAD